VGPAYSTIKGIYLMKRLVLVLFALALMAGISSAQFVEAWNTRAVGPFGSESFDAGVEHADGGIVAVGGQFNQPFPRFETVLCRMDVNGNVLWRNVYVYNNQHTSLFDMCARTGFPGEFVGVGYTEPGSRHFFILHFNAAGSILNAWSYSTSGGGELHTIAAIPGGGYIVGGVTNSDPAFVMKLDNNLTPVWSNTYTSTLSYNKIYDIIPTSDGGFAFCTLSYQSPNRWAWTVKLNGAGVMQWDTMHTGFYFGVGNCIIETPDNGFITAGYYDNGPGNQYMAIKCNSAGTMVWSSTFGVDNGDEQCDFIGAAPGGGYYLYGDGESPFTIDSDTWLIKIDENGNEEWNQLFQRVLNQTVESCVMVNGGQDMVTFGEENIFWTNDGDCHAVRLNLAGDLEAEIAAINPPVIIPAGGGSFGYSVTATNNTNSGMQVDAWIQVLHVQSNMSVEVQNFSNVGLAAGSSASANLNQFIPSDAPGGLYQISLYLGNYPWDFEVFASFNFSKDGVVADAVDMGIFERPEQWISRGGFEGVESIVTSEDILPSDFRLGTAYPNPFNPSTTLSVNLPESAELNVSVFNVTGQQVAALANGQFNAGSHTLTFDASNLSGGVYFVHASANGLSAVQKVVLMK
jgi:Secretion system C-terminal sorting domain